MSVTPVTFPDLSAIAPIAGMGQTTPVTPDAGLDPTAATSGATAVTGTSGATGVTGSADTGGTDFGSLVADGLDRLEGLQNTSSNLAVQAATGDLSAIHDYTIAATEASTATQLTVALRNQAIGAFNQIMQMQV